MAEWDRKKVEPSIINGGKEFTCDDNLSTVELNAMVNNSFYSVEFAEALADNPDTSSANNVGTPSVTLVDNVKDGKTYKKFKFSNLKGATGAKGDKGDKGEKGEPGETNSLITYLGVLWVSQMPVSELFNTINQNFGTNCRTYYLVPSGGILKYPIVVSAELDGVSSSSTLIAGLTNKWMGQTTSINVKKIRTGSNVGVREDINSIFKYDPYVLCDYVEIGKCSSAGINPDRYNVRCSWSGYELNILQEYSTSSCYIKCEDSAIKIYGVV